MQGDLKEIRSLIAEVATGRPMSLEESERAFDVIMSGNATPAQMGGLLMALRVRGETVDEILGAARTMRAKMTTIEAPAGAIDTCGTGGDAKGTYNISTAAAFVVAACGVPVAKHGNRALSSKSGAADVLGALGIDVETDMATVQRALWEVGTCFLMAPRHHSAMRHVGPTRVELGTRTIFNLLGPLCNPAKVRRQIMGVFDRAWIEPLAEVLKGLGHEKAWVFHGEGGFDELTTSGTSWVAALADGRVRTFEVTPEAAGLPRCSPDDLKGGDAETNAAAIRALLGGQHGPFRDTVLLTSAAALIVADKAGDLKQGVAKAAEALDSGRAMRVLERLIQVTDGKTPV
ncbi:anthranilate phosphoribosyltransferase [Tistlia consotensis]|uniref:Anthranilate phosphoribosyltransferase n=1 Tax=Tistlia consotensis USBA 355 TaxID=560819 RepID=A0A1Y6CQ37_9PROT|nr:anthranilate phosphoribosyltransferase [Tistlia consotensis]SMF69890.1 anthranilate phosphoribosyltransferase [Tistlia consotensis USBA 355]SNS05168.1 anthranilate phosphoribosyltransferase [Tistlia consotensis]